MEKNIPDRRKNYYIKKKFQRNFILKFFALLLLGAFISGVIIYLMSRGALTTTFDNSRLAIRSTAEYILPSVLLSSAAVMIIIGFAAIIMTLFASHKIAGPLYHIGKDIDELASGNLNVRFKLRGGDEIKELAYKLDSMAQSLSLRAAAIKKALSSLESSSKDASPETKKSIQDLREAISKFNV
ncbi:MAG: methyl-accepting chemotaxis protein [Candidatus Omnitrophica bacterium]|nr:methyl-accepting chemotaxis protein [Candidatus Omnitrophota bacterium]